LTPAKKFVDKVETQKENESRKVWVKVAQFINNLEYEKS